MTPNAITIEVVVNAPISKVWEYWNKPEHIHNWAFASDDWEARGAENDLRVGGTFKTIMGAKNKSASFEFGGVYTAVTENQDIAFIMSDGREVKTQFTTVPEGVKISESFDPESENSAELQKSGWQAILDNFKKYAERTA